MGRSRTEVIRARVTEEEAAKLNALTQRLGASTASETLRLLLAGASVEPRFVLTVHLPEKANGSEVRQDHAAIPA